MDTHKILYNFYHYFRHNKEAMIKLRKVLPESVKARRHRRSMANLQITFLAWLTEVVGFLIIFLGTFVLGHENNHVNSLMQLLTLVVYFNILPCIYLVNDSQVLSQIIDTSWYNSFLDIFNCQYTIRSDGEDSTDIVGNQVNEDNPIPNGDRQININGSRHESSNCVEQRQNQELQPNVVNKDENSVQVIEKTKTKSGQEQCLNSADYNEPIHVSNDVVVYDL